MRYYLCVLQKIDISSILFQLPMGYGDFQSFKEMMDNCLKMTGQRWFYVGLHSHKHVIIHLYHTVYSLHDHCWNMSQRISCIDLLSTKSNWGDEGKTTAAMWCDFLKGIKLSSFFYCSRYLKAGFVGIWHKEGACWNPEEISSMYLSVILFLISPSP